MQFLTMRAQPYAYRGVSGSKFRATRFELDILKCTVFVLIRDLVVKGKHPSNFQKFKKI